MTSKARVTSNPEIMGGTPCFAGTRIPVSLILRALASGMSWLTVAAQWPSIDGDRIKDALDYAASVSDANPAHLRRKLTEMQRRAQAAESAARVTVEEVRRAGVSLGRSLSQWAAADLDRRLKLLQEQVLVVLESGVLEPEDAGELERAAFGEMPRPDFMDIVTGRRPEDVARTLSSEVWP